MNIGEKLDDTGVDMGKIRKDRLRRRKLKMSIKNMHTRRSAELARQLRIQIEDEIDEEITEYIKEGREDAGGY